MEKQYLKGLVTKVNDDFTLEVAVASTPDKDRQGEIIKSTAWRLENFRRNPVLQWAHDYRSIPIGKVEQISVEGDKLLFRPRFAAHIDEFAAKVWKMFKEGYLNAFSVGFQSLAPKEEDSFTDVELLEISAVPVPANPNALVVARSLGIELECKSEHDGVCDPESPDYDPEECARRSEEKVEPEVIGDLIHVRVRDPKLFVQDSFRTIDISETEGIKSVIGKLISDPQGSTVVQKFMFDKNKWTIDEAVEWVSEHKSMKEQNEAPENNEHESDEQLEEPESKDNKIIHGHISDAFSAIRELVNEQERVLLDAADQIQGNEASKSNSILTAWQKVQIETTKQTLKLAADALTDVLQSATVKDNDGAPKAGSNSAPAENEALSIVRNALKRADRQIAVANRAIKIKLTSKS